MVSIHKGTRQGCPLSRLLFISTLEATLETEGHKRPIRGQQFKVQFKAMTY